MRLFDKVPMQFPTALKDIFKPARYKVMYGGRGGAKSESVAQYLVLSMLNETHPNPVYGCFRETQNSLSESVKPLMMSIIHRCGLSEYFYTAETSARITCLLNGGKFVFSGLSNPKQINKVRSMHGLIKVWIEESEGVTEYAWDIFTPSIRGADDSEILITFNPDRKADFIYQHFVVNKPPPDAWVKKVNYYDNPWFPAVLEKERQACLVYPNKYKRIWLGFAGFTERQLIKDEWWQYYTNLNVVLAAITGMFITVDTANKDGELHCFSVAQCWGYNGRHRLYLIDQIKGKWLLPKLIREVEKFMYKCYRLCKIVKPDKVFVEDKQSGTSLVQIFNSKRIACAAWSPKKFKFSADKVGRVCDASVIIADLFVYLPKTAPWLKGFLEECSDFGEVEVPGAFNDQVDAMTMAVSIWRSRGGGRIK